MVELERNFKIQLVPSTPDLQMSRTGEPGRLTCLISPRGTADQATARPYLGILPAMPSSVVLPRQVLPPQCLHPSCRKH